VLGEVSCSLISSSRQHTEDPLHSYFEDAVRQVAMDSKDLNKSKKKDDSKELDSSDTGANAPSSSASTAGVKDDPDTKALVGQKNC
jgi:hypothetical protein